MTIEITRNSTSQLTDARSAAAPKNTSSDAAKSGSSAVQSSPQDVVNITDTAVKLKQIEEQLKTVPIVDDLKVSELRGALNSGNFEVNAERVADKIISFEIDTE